MADDVILEKLSSNLVASSDQNNIILENDLDEVKKQKVSLQAVEELIQKSVKYQYLMILNDNIASKRAMPKVNQHTENCNNKQPFNNFEFPMVPEVTFINSEWKFKLVFYNKKRKPEILGNQNHSSSKAVTKLASVYISRIDPSSTVESIENHLKENEIEQYLGKKGFSKHPDVYKSFIVTTPQEVKVKQPELWPEGASVSNFLYRPMKIKEMQKYLSSVVKVW
ncbi:hypothetical protein HHI36_009113 [Cryptolaemus montrouzieri]|uniref:Uncharacterized protein n=1 Tax=Cryptolaemus montrouzieri TaxID=559131 RepID=A0ABD2MUW2_9CUCU